MVSSTTGSVVCTGCADGCGVGAARDGAAGSISLPVYTSNLAAGCWIGLLWSHRIWALVGLQPQVSCGAVAPARGAMPTVTSPTLFFISLNEPSIVEASLPLMVCTVSPTWRPQAAAGRLL